MWGNCVDKHMVTSPHCYMGERPYYFGREHVSPPEFEGWIVLNRIKLEKIITLQKGLYELLTPSGIPSGFHRSVIKSTGCRAAEHTACPSFLWSFILISTKYIVSKRLHWRRWVSEVTRVSFVNVNQWGLRTRGRNILLALLPAGVVHGMIARSGRIIVGLSWGRLSEKNETKTIMSRQTRNYMTNEQHYTLPRSNKLKTTVWNNYKELWTSLCAPSLLHWRTQGSDKK